MLTYPSFQGYSCTGPGDLIADTAAHIAPTRGCPIGLDTCPDEQGPDPIHNYMDYSIESVAFVQTSKF
jgi:hypothetical protein